MPDQIPFGAQEFGAGLDFAENPEPRCILLLDTSASMGGHPISQLNEGLVSYKNSLTADSLAAKRVEVAIITFGGVVQTACDFTVAHNFTPPTVVANGDTPMGAAILHASAMLRQRKENYKAHGIAYYRPWLFLITDGAPTDDWRAAADEVKAGEAAKAFAFFAIGVEGANFDILKQIAVRDPLRLQGFNFREMFLWLSSSQQSVSRSTPGDSVPLANPTAPGGWASV
jgi:uncharacterized protein YegL